LVAATMMGLAHIRRALGADFDLILVSTFFEAVQALKSGCVDAILCSIHFDESQMFSFLLEATRIAPDTPFICCQILATTLKPTTISATVSAAESKGALGFIDYNGVLRSRGADEADKVLREELRRLLPPDMGCAAVAGVAN